MDVNVFGLSTLRHANDTKGSEGGKNSKQEPSEKAKQLQAYLNEQYGIDSKTKKKKKKKKKHVAQGSVAIIDGDAETSLKTMSHTTVEDSLLGGEVDDEDAPVVVNAGEFRRLQLQEEKQKALLEKQQGSWKVIQGIADDMPSSSSPPRRRRRARHDSDNESEDQDIDGDESPPRRRARHDSDNESEDQDIDGDESPPRRRARHDSDNEGEDQDGDGDESPPRRRVHADDDTTTVPYDAKSEAIRMSDGSLAGMISGKELMKEMEEKRRREREQFAALGDHVTGRHAETVYRTEDGRAVSKKEYLEDMEQKRSQEKKYLEGSEIPWGKGLKQTAQDAGMTSSIDEEGPSRWDDPMAHILNRKPAKGDEPIITGSLLDKYAKQLKKAGFHVPLEIPKHSWLRRNLGAPPNRYGIKPGRHWDGVDRSNGFERELFKRQAELKRREHMAHMMAQEDM